MEAGRKEKGERTPRKKKKKKKKGRMLLKEGRQEGFAFY